jgi:hypothetical protein
MVDVETQNFVVASDPKIFNWCWVKRRAVHRCSWSGVSLFSAWSRVAPFHVVISRSTGDPGQPWPALQAESRLKTGKKTKREIDGERRKRGESEERKKKQRGINTKQACTRITRHRQLLLGG